MAVTLTTSAGEIYRNATTAQFNQALGLLFPVLALQADRQPLRARHEFIYMVDDAGNELTLTARGTLRLYLANSPGNDYALRLGPGGATEGRELCGRFFRGDLEWVRAQPWERNAAAEDGDFPTAAPLPGARGVMVFGPAADEPGGHPVAPRGDCPRCGGAMAAGFLVAREREGFRVMHYQVFWTAGENPEKGWSTAVYPAGEVHPMMARRCQGCGHVEFSA